MRKDKTYAKGLVTGVFATIFVALLIFLAAVFFNIGNVGNLLQTVKILDHYSLKPLSFSEKAEGAIAGMLNELEDPYSYYLDAEDYTDLMEEVSGSYEGLGIYLTTEADAEYTVVMAPIKGTPAFEAGLLAGDEIVRLNGEDMAGVAADEIATLIKRGEESHFVMEVRRDGEILTFEMDRRHIDIPSVDGTFLEGQEGIAYISISTFAENTPTELEETIASLEKQGAIRGILLDLRNNPGGLSGPAVRPVALRMVWQSAQKISIPIIGMGGIETGEDAAAFMLCGAKAVQVGTANFTDPFACPRIVKELNAYCDAQGAASAQEIVGTLRAY